MPIKRAHGPRIPDLARLIDEKRECGVKNTASRWELHSTGSRRDVTTEW